MILGRQLLKIDLEAMPLDHLLCTLAHEWRASYVLCKHSSSNNEFEEFCTFKPVSLLAKNKHFNKTLSCDALLLYYYNIFETDA